MMLVLLLLLCSAGLRLYDFYEVPASNTALPPRCGSSTGSGLGIGAWALMADSWGPCGDQLWVPHMSPFSKYMLGWVNPIEVSADEAKSFKLFPSAQCPDILKITRGYTPDVEFILVENRQAIGVDSATMGTGMLV
jgi:M6 family metalloprotease-like protein